MDRIAALSALAAAIVLLAGCQAPTPAGAPTPEPTADGARSPSGTREPADRGTTTTPATPPADRLGWEAGYAHDAAVAVNATDGLNATELDAVVARAMARVEYIRRMEFRESVPVSVISRAEYRERYGGSGDAGPARRAYANARYEALFLVGEGEDALAVRARTFGSVVVGFYSPGEDRIVLVSGRGTPTVDETVLAHELVHALQYRRLGAGELSAPTFDGRNARNGLIEGDARYVDARYAGRCGGAWSCVTPAGFGTGGGSGDFRFELYFLSYFPYSDGPVFVRHVREAGGWERVNALYDAPPKSAEQVISPRKYGFDRPRDVALRDRSSRAWSPVAPGRGPAAGRLGQAAIAAAFAHPTFDERPGLVVPSGDLINKEPGGDRLRTIDPFEYGFGYADGWDGDAFRVYEARDGDLAYVWRIAWDSPTEAKEFAAGYRELLAYWGGERVNGSERRWRIPEGESGYADAFYLAVSGDTVTIANAPSPGELPAVYAPAGER